MTDSAANEIESGGDQQALAEILAGVEPMGDLSVFALEDLSEEEEREFFSILGDV